MGRKKVLPEMFDRISITIEARLSKDDDRTEDKRIEGLFMGISNDPANEIISIKLENGYNLGIALNRIKDLQILERAIKGPTRPLEHVGSGMSGAIALLSTGGTIAARVDYATGAVHPVISPNDLLKDVTSILPYANVCPRIVGSLLSEDMRPKDWTNLAQEVVMAFSQGAKGCVITHGTDTISMTSTALSFLLQNLPGPVILVGSQRSSDRPSSDSLINLRDALIAAKCSDIGEVLVLMHGSISDDITYLHRGTCVRKMHTSRRDAFESVNSSPVGIIEDGKVLLRSPLRRSSKKGVITRGGFEEKVVAIKATPQLEGPLLTYLGKRYRAMVIEGTGLGHIRSDLIKEISGIVAKDIPVIITSSCPYGIVNLNVYSTGREMLKAGVIPSYEMGTETSMIKTMYLMDMIDKEGDGFNMERFRELFQTDISGELNMRTEIDSFGSMKVKLKKLTQDRQEVRS